ncbi:hypothetical protein A2110_01315 [Candidatus Jorgensenbacteria bacterium GWA1_54_12]|uniref:VWFA domain-containing protein n=1 Tax=Candidatus Jorgensenbacteria bacterium GWA1_54_12 TaxID=1798468 RepID=A0A1F6BKQ5_9BACT|nr:MAG: hypothetical protein A2110_01315 [Candidatus Jorgensenbacteria bacterium GWA1_54_12]
MASLARATFVLLVAVVAILAPLSAHAGIFVSPGEDNNIQPGQDMDLPEDHSNLLVAVERSIDEMPSFFDQELEVQNERIIFVIDQSGSMGWAGISYTDPFTGRPAIGTMMDRAKAEVIRAITALPATWRFSVVAFDCGVRAWRFTTAMAVAENKADASTWVWALMPMGATNTSEGVIRALMMDRECLTVALLTDGAPNCFCPPTVSGTGSWDAYARACNDWHLGRVLLNNTQGATINTFGIGASGLYEQFLMNMAMQTGGTYTAISM